MAKAKNLIYSIEVDMNGSRRRITMEVGKDFSTLTLSDCEGNVLEHIMQKGNSIETFRK
jgi:hypothetical protein